MKKVYTLFLIFILLSASSFIPDNDKYEVGDVKTKITNFYPNPASSFINFEFSKPLEKGHTIALYNFIGKKVSEIPVSGSKITVSLDGFFRGIYVFQLRNRNATIIESGKFQVIK